MSVIESVKLQINKPIPASRFKVLSFSGIADGTKLERIYDVESIRGNYLRIIKVIIAYYTDNSIWIKNHWSQYASFIWDATTRYEVIQNNIRIPPKFFELFYQTNEFKMLIDSIPLGIFPNDPLFSLKCAVSAFEHFDLNVISEQKISDGIDIKYNMSFVSDMEQQTVLNPFVQIMIPVELIPNLETIKFSK